MKYDLNSFVNKLLLEKGISGLSPEVMDQLRSDLVERAENIINAEILANIPKDDLAEFEKKLDEGNDSETQAFCNKHIKNMDEVVANGLIKLKNLYLGDK